MSDKATLRKISQFQPDGTEQRRQLSQLENDIAEAIEAVIVRAAARFKPTVTQITDFRAGINDLVVCAGTLTVLLPTANKANAGRSVAVLRKSGTVTVTAVTSKIQGSASETLTTNGLRVYVSDGLDWWRAP